MTINDRWTPLSAVDRLLLPVQLGVGIYLLMVAPADVALWLLNDNDMNVATTTSAIVGTLPYEYVFFFASLVFPRVYRFGKFERPTIAAVNTSSPETAVLRPVLFALTLVGAHWTALYQYTLATATTITSGASTSSSQDEILLFFTVLRLLAIA